MPSDIGEGGTDVEIFAKEEAVIALSACRHRAHAELSCSPLPPTRRVLRLVVNGLTF